MSIITDLSKFRWREKYLAGLLLTEALDHPNR